MNFDQILTKFDKILIIYVKNQQMHVDNIQGRHFLRKKNPCGMYTHRTGVGVGGGIRVLGGGDWAIGGGKKLIN